MERSEKIQGFHGGSDDKESARNTGDLGSIPGSGRFPWRREWQPTLVFLPGKCHGQRSLVGYTVHGVTKSWIQLTNTLRRFKSYEAISGQEGIWKLKIILLSKTTRNPDKPLATTVVRQWKAGGAGLWHLINRQQRKWALNKGRDTHVHRTDYDSVKTELSPRWHTDVRKSQLKPCRNL